MPTEVELVTPERVLYSGEAGFVVLRTDGGEIMFLPEHAPFIAAVDICVVRIDATGAESSAADRAGGGDGSGGTGGRGTSGAPGEVRAAVAGGFVHVANNRVTVLAGVAELADEIDVERARRAFDSASAEAASGERTGTGRDEEERRRTAAPSATAGRAADSDDEPAREEVAETPTMRALVYPDEPDVRARRVANRLEAAGEADQSTSAVAAGAAPASQR